MKRHRMRPSGVRSSKPQLPIANGTTAVEAVGSSGRTTLDLSMQLLVPALLFWLVAKWLFATGRYFGQDEIESMHQGWLLHTGALQFKDFNSNHPPLFFELLGLLNHLTSDAVRLLDLGRALTFLSSALQLALLYPIARAAHGERAARWTIVVYATCATYLETSIEIRTDTLMLPLFFGALWLLLGCERVGPRWRLFGIGLLMGTAFWANQKVAYHALPMGIFLLLGGPTRAWRARTLWIAAVGALIPSAFCFGSALLDGNLAELWQLNFAGAVSMVASDPYQIDRARTLARLPMRDPGLLVLSIIAFGWSLARIRHLTRGGRFILAAAAWSAVTFFLTPGPFPYYFLGVLSLCAVVVGKLLAAVEIPRGHRAWVIVGVVALLVLHHPTRRVWKFRTPTNTHQKEIIRIGTELTDADTPVFDGAGLLIRRPDAYTFHWILWVQELLLHRKGELPPLLPTIREGGARLVIWNYRLDNLLPNDRRALKEKFPTLWGPLRVPGFDSLDRAVGSDPVTFDLWYDGLYEVSTNAVLIDGHPVDSTIWLKAGLHRVSVLGESRHVVIRDASHRDRVTLPPKPKHRRFFGQYGYYF